MSIAFTFPGQGSQSIGMGAELASTFPSAREVFDEVDDALDQKLSHIMWEGEQDMLTLTENAQPALLAVSMAVIRVLDREKGFDFNEKVRYVAGHSLGEYSALAAAGALTISDAARLLRTRGRAMQAAVPVGEGAMAALLGLDLADAKKAAGEAAQGEVCQAANDNAPGQVVLSGTKSAIERAIELAQSFGARRAILLPVSAPFHSALMQPAAEVMVAALREVDIRPPTVPLVANVLASEINDPNEIRQCLVEQVTGLVRWRESINYLAGKGVTSVFEIGAGRVLTGLARRIERSLNTVSVETPADVDAAVEVLAG
ncbi:malonyl CoA-acyl carrier protein transacylase [bacterium MnTg02]|nr:malonyl CoA-acyl carrier protein transacylase [bacterium MnTg02]